MQNLQAISANIAADIAAIKRKSNERLLSKQMFRYSTPDGKVCTFKQVNILSSSDSFGEVSIVTNNKLRTASIVSAGNSIPNHHQTTKSSNNAHSEPIHLANIAEGKQDHRDNSKDTDNDDSDEDNEEDGLHLLSIAGTDYVKVFD